MCFLAGVYQSLPNLCLHPDSWLHLRSLGAWDSDGGHLRPLQGSLRRLHRPLPAPVRASRYLGLLRGKSRGEFLRRNQVLQCALFNWMRAESVFTTTDSALVDSFSVLDDEWNYIKRGGVCAERPCFRDNWISEFKFSFNYCYFLPKYMLRIHKKCQVAMFSPVMLNHN